MISRHISRIGIFILLFAACASSAYAQMPRERANQDGPVDEVFWAPSLILTNNVTNLDKNNLDFTIKHAFGIATNGAEDLFGLDAAANIRFGLDFGVTDRFSVGFGRSRFDKLYDFRTKINLLRQTQDNRIPIELAFAGTAGINTLKNGYDFNDRLSYASSLMIARKFSDRVSLQIAPIFTHFNLVTIERDSQDNIVREMHEHLAVAFGGQFGLTERMALILEYIPVFSDRSDGTKDALSVGLDIETGGHVFQLFFTTSQGMTEQHVIARNVDQFFDGDFRFGFNVHRVFSF